MSRESLVSTNELGFAAFLMLKGYKMIRFAENKWWFESDESINELRVRWINSEFSKFDKILLDLKRFKQ